MGVGEVSTSDSVPLNEKFLAWPLASRPEIFPSSSETVDTPMPVAAKFGHQKRSEICEVILQQEAGGFAGI